jgi:hypothetical protein
MDNKLADELKNAGFPQRPMPPHETDMPHCWCDPRKEVQPNGGIVIVHHDAYRPSLQELIEEMGEEFYTLERQGNGFEAHSRIYNNYEWEKSPLNAVARLYIALQKVTPRTRGD